MGHVNELDRQTAVLAAWQTPLPAHVPLNASQACWPFVQAAKLATDAAGLRAYQINAQATAQRVLASTYPTIAAMLGADTLSALALILWQQQPPSSGDLGDWGSALPDLLDAHPDLKPWPWLADSARLEWARHVCECAADAELDAGSLQRLGDTAPEHLYLQLKPCIQVLPSSWPIVGLWEAHRLPADQQQAAATQVLSQAPVGSAVVWRHPWLVQMLCLTGAQADWMARLSANTASPQNTALNLADMLDQALPDFDFTIWLTQALSQGWLWRVTSSA
jgi:hypothetical protein